MKKLIKYILFVLILMTVNSCMSGKKSIKYSPKEFDILFQDLECGDLCSAIKEVTVGIDSSEFSHIGLVQKIDEKWMVLEAISDGVKYTDLLEFFKRSIDKNNHPKIWVGRVRKEYWSILENLDASPYIGQPYDDAFLMNNGKYYCSELLYEIFKKANKGVEFFDLEPMTFKSLESEKYLNIWLDYYQKLGIDIPEGKAGINPAGISRSDKIEIVQKLGVVSRKGRN